MVDAIESNGMVSLLVLLCLFSIGILRNIHLPGIYMDAVNPDYLAAKILAGDRYINHFPPWDEFPVLGQLYHGVMHTYFGLIFFYIFGMSTFSLRVAHAIFGFGILLITHKILDKAIGSRFYSLLITSILALDPSFVFAFRTQYYITLSPMLFLLSSFYLLLLIRDIDDGLSLKIPYLCFVSGLLAGFSFYGYFIYIFFVPAYIYMIVRFAREHSCSVLRIVSFWSVGFMLGASLYFYGYARIILNNGLSEIIKGASGMNIVGHQIGFFGSLKLSLLHVISSLSGDKQYKLIFDQMAPNLHGDIKLIVIAIVILASISILVAIKRFDRILGYTLLLIASFIVSSLYFAARLAPHHMITLLPLVYIALGISLHEAVLYSSEKMGVSANKMILMVFSPLFLLLIILNLQDQNLFQKKLEQTGGVHYYSDALTLLAEEANHSPNAQYYVFGEWGFSTSFSFLTEGKIPYDTALDDWAISQVPCNKDLVFVFWGLLNPLVKNFASEWGHESNRQVFYQRDGVVSFTALTISDRKACPSSNVIYW